MLGCTASGYDGPIQTFGYAMFILSALLPACFRSQPSSPVPVETCLRVVEGVESTWSYHLAHGPQRDALCDPARTMMQTNLPLSAWGYKSDHLPERYCDQCASIANRDNLGPLGPAVTAR